MFLKSKIVRLACWALVAASWLPIGNALSQPTQANAAEIIRVGPVVRPVPIVRVKPVHRHLWYGHGWFGFRWVR
jgi:hypothetical protein